VGRGALVAVPSFEASFSGTLSGPGDLAAALAAAGVPIDRSTLQTVGAAGQTAADEDKSEGKDESGAVGSLFLGPGALNGHGDTPLMVAVAGGQLSAAAWLVTRMAHESRVASAAASRLGTPTGATRALAKAAAEAAWLDAVNVSGDSALSLAATHADAAMADLLLKAGASPYPTHTAAPVAKVSARGPPKSVAASVEGFTEGLTPKGADLVGSMLQELQSGSKSTQRQGGSSSNAAAVPAAVPARDPLAAAEWAVAASAGSPAAVQAAAARCVALVLASRADVAAAADALAAEAADGVAGSSQQAKGSKAKRGKKKGAAARSAPSAEAVEGPERNAAVEGEEEEDEPEGSDAVEEARPPRAAKEAAVRASPVAAEAFSAHGNDLGGWLAPKQHGKAKGARQPSPVATPPPQLHQTKALLAAAHASDAPRLPAAVGEEAASAAAAAAGAERAAFDRLVAKACFGGSASDDSGDAAALVATLGLTPAALWLEDPRALALHLSPSQLACAGQLLAARVAAVQDARVLQARVAALTEARNEALNQAEANQTAALAAPALTLTPTSTKELPREMAGSAPWLHALEEAEPVD
jgi:ankyrin repeat protein